MRSVNEPLTLEQAVQALFASGRLNAEQTVTAEDIEFLNITADLVQTWFDRRK